MFLKKKLLLALAVLLASIAQLFIAAPARAECEADGETFQTGDTYGPYVCMPDGTWQQQ